MAYGTVFTNNGRKAAMHRIFDAAPAYSRLGTSFKVGTGTTTPAVTDTDLQTPILIGGVASKAVVAGYPVLDDTSLNITTRGLLLTTECNGNTLTEFGLINADGTPIVSSHAVYSPIVKTTSVQVIYVQKDLIGV